MHACRILSLLVKSENTFTFILVTDYLQVSQLDSNPVCGAISMRRKQKFA